MTNPMRKPIIEKVTVNIGIGAPGENLENAKKLLGALTDATIIETKSKGRNPVFKLRKDLPIGVKTTLRGSKALDFLNKALDARKRKLNSSNFDKTGNFSFGIAEYIDFPGAKYDPNIGMLGFDVCVTLKRKGARVGKRKIKTSKIGKKHYLTKEDGIEFARTKFNITIE